MNNIKDIGKQLVKHSSEAKSFSAQRGVLDELFPFIFEASRRMSLRAIGRWLQSEHKISLSPNTLARSLRNAEKYWVQILEEIAPSVRLLARDKNASALQILTSDDLIPLIEADVPTSPEEETQYSEQMDAVEVIKEFWAWMPPNALHACLACVGEVFEEDENNESVGDDDE